MNIPTLDVARAAIAPYLLAIKIGALVVLLIAAGVLYWRVTVWHQAFRTLEATEKALATITADRDRYAAAEASAWQALREAEGKAKAKEAEDRATTERIERELQDRLAAADGRGRDLARRLLYATRKACPGGGAVPGAAGAAAQPAPAAGEPGDGEAIERAVADHVAACARDAERLAGWQAWWAGVSAGR